jgi:hypothetical protein
LLLPMAHQLLLTALYSTLDPMPHYMRYLKPRVYHITPITIRITVILPGIGYWRLRRRISPSEK